MNILIVIEEKPLANFIAKVLSGEGYATVVTNDRTTAEGALALRRANLVLVDCSTSEALLRSLKTSAALVPMIALTGNNTVEGRCALLDAGADDCLAKPFSSTELLTRVRVFVRRQQALMQHEIQYKSLSVNRLTRSVRRDGKLIELTPKEYALLEYLLLNAGKTVSRHMILEDVWRVHFDTMTNVVDVYINYLRRKIDQGHPDKLITTIRGSGYCIGTHDTARATN